MTQDQANSTLMFEKFEVLGIYRVSCIRNLFTALRDFMTQHRRLKPVIILEMAVEEDKVMQDFNLESLSTWIEHSQMVKELLL